MQGFFVRYEDSTKHYANTPTPDCLCCSELTASHRSPEGTGQHYNGSALYNEREGSLPPSSRGTGQVSSSIDRKTNHSYAGTQPSAQPRGVHLAVLDLSHKATSVRMGASAFIWQGGLCHMGWQSTVSPGAPVSGRTECFSQAPLFSGWQGQLCFPTGLSSEPPPMPNELLPPHLLKLQTLDCVANAAIPWAPDDCLWNHLSLTERGLCFCFTYLLG